MVGHLVTRPRQEGGGFPEGLQGPWRISLSSLGGRWQEQSFLVEPRQLLGEEGTTTTVTLEKKRVAPLDRRLAKTCPSSAWR